VELYLAVTNNRFPYVKEETPAWVDVLYGPMDFLRGCHDGNNPFNHYYWWWTERLRQ